jgi:ABC-type sugar transport system ATPase subunit
MGSESHVHLMCGAGSLVARLPASAAVRVNERLAFVLEMRQAHFFDPATQSVIL